MIWCIGRTGEDRKFLFGTTRQDERSASGIAYGKALDFELFANTIRLLIARVMAQCLTFTNLTGDLSGNSLQIDLWITLLEGAVTQEIVFEIEAENMVKIEEQTHTRCRITRLRAQHSPDNRHCTRHIQIVLNLGQKCGLPGIGYWRLIRQGLSFI